MLNYKKLIKSRTLRIKILNALSWIPDEPMVRLQYRIHTGRKLNLKNPTRFTEKLQLYKLRYRNPLMLTDKYEVRNVIEEMGYGDILIPLIGIYNSPEEIPIDNLPNEFVTKTTDGGGGQQVFICRDKSRLDRVEFLRKLNEWMSMPKIKPVGREWAYENRYPRRIIIEKLIKSDNSKDLPDYKFFCFGGKVCMVYGVNGRNLGIGAQIGIYTRDFVKIEVSRNDEFVQEQSLPKPLNYERILEIAESIGQHFPHVRVDFYNVAGRIYFGELTFYDGSGYMTFSPDSYDEELGRCWNISEFY